MARCLPRSAASPRLANAPNCRSRPVPMPKASGPGTRSWQSAIAKRSACWQTRPRSTSSARASRSAGTTPRPPRWARLARSAPKHCAIARPRGWSSRWSAIRPIMTGCATGTTRNSPAKTRWRLPVNESGQSAGTPRASASAPNWPSSPRRNSRPNASIRTLPAQWNSGRFPTPAPKWNRTASTRSGRPCWPIRQS